MDIRMFNEIFIHMKKLILTCCAAALFSAGALAQTQQPAKTESNQYRNTKKTERTEQKIDSATNEAEEGVRETGREVQQGAERTGDQAEQKSEQAGENIQRATEETGEDIRQGVNETGNAAGERVEELKKEGTTKSNQVKEDARQQGEQMKEGAEKTMNKVQGQVDSATSESSATDSGMAAAPVDVVDGKEGPMGEVVYKFGDDMFYIDQTKEKKLVKVKDSELKESRHQVRVSDNPVSTDSKKKGKRSNKG
jgi:hypothetical protein